MKTPENFYDAIVIGAGPAGLTAAIYLGRFRRRCLVLADGLSRARWIPTSHNIPGFTTGIGGEHFLAALNDQALMYGAQIRQAHVWKLNFSNGLFTLHTDGETLHSRFILLATGVRDRLPAIDGAEEAVLKSVLRVCPICDAFEAIDKRIGVIGDGPLGEREADFLTNYSSNVTLMHLGPLSTLPVGSGRFETLAIQVSDLRIEERRVSLSSAEVKRDFDVVYLALGCEPQHDLARSLSARCDEHGALEVSPHQETSVPGLYAAGDVVRGLNQVVVAAAESAIAATAIHNRLRDASSYLPVRKAPAAAKSILADA